MPALATPDTRFHASFLEAQAELPDLGFLFRGRRLELDQATGFATYVSGLLDDAQPEAPRPEGYVPCTTLWWADGDRYLGRVAIRHELNEPLRRIGGHIGYLIRPSARGCGHGRAAFRASLPMAAALGIDPALLTCDADNVPSRRIIEGAGGVFEDQIGDKRRYWVPTGTGAAVQLDPHTA
jgi:predicted acetyltransferase